LFLKVFNVKLRTKNEFLLRHFKVFGYILSLHLLVSCGLLPSSGPSGNRIAALGNSETALPDVELVDVNYEVAQYLYQAKVDQSLSQFGSKNVSAGAINVGDVLDIAIWEAPPAVLFGGALSSIGSGNAQQTKLPEQMVSAAGTISVPFIGNIKVAGKTPTQVQDVIRGRLKKMANQPQVVVRLVQNNAATVSVIRAGNSVRMPLTTAGERVLDAVTRSRQWLLRIWWLIRAKIFYCSVAMLLR